MVQRPTRSGSGSEHLRCRATYAGIFVCPTIAEFGSKLRDHRISRLGLPNNANGDGNQICPAVRAEVRRCQLTGRRGLLVLAESRISSLDNPGQKIERKHLRSGLLRKGNCDAADAGNAGCAHRFVDRRGVSFGQHKGTVASSLLIQLGHYTPVD